jgi:hypothetical protein
MSLLRLGAACAGTGSAITAARQLVSERAQRGDTTISALPKQVHELLALSAELECRP